MPPRIYGQVKPRRERILQRAGKVYPPGYVDQLFTLWYSMGKPQARLFYSKIPASDLNDNTKPSYVTVERWIIDIFKDRAVALDDQVMTQMHQQMVAEKVEMLNRHAELGVTMQNMALKYLDEHANDLNANSSVKLLVEGVRIERESRGISSTVEKIESLSDEDIMKEFRKIVEKNPVELLATGEGILDADSDNQQQTDE